MKKGYIWILLLSIFSSCSTSQHESLLIRFTYDNEKSTPLTTYPVFEDVDIVPLETTNEALLNPVEAVEVHDSLLFVKDRNAVFIFKRNGKFVARVGRQGAGPEEYSSIGTFYIDKKNENVAILDVLKFAVLKYDFKGRYVFSYKVPVNSVDNITQVILYDNSTLMCSHRINYGLNMAYTVIQENESDSYFSYAPITAQDYTYFLSNHQMSKSEDEIHFIMPLCDTIFSFSDKRFSAKYSIDLLSQLPPREKFQTSAEKTYSEFIHEYAKEGYFPGFTALFETESKLLLEYKPQGVALGYYLGDKETHDGTYYAGTFGVPMKEMPFFQIKHAFDNTFVGVEDANDLLMLKENIGIDDTNNAQLSKLKKVIDTLKFDDNPVLFFYYFKKNNS